MRFARVALALAFVFALAAAMRVQDERDPLRITDRLHHLGDNDVDDWEDCPVKPEGLRVDLEFEAQSNEVEATFEIDQNNVHSRWAIQLNGKEIGTLDLVIERGVRHYSVPPRAVRDGKNTLSIVLLDVPEGNKDDIAVGNIVLHWMSFREMKNLRPLTVRVKDELTGYPIPARLTLVDLEENFVQIYLSERPTTAIRPGIAYTGEGEIVLEVPAGKYVLYASRGMEWSRARQEIELNAAMTLDLELERQVDTTGYVAADTHIHTLQFSGHGDASAAERIVTLAGEGLELPISTDHNHQTDYRPFQEELGMNAWFTPVVGNEVTTGNGHFNAFPLPAGGPIPKHRIPKWPALMDNIRETGAQVVVWNHPRWPYDENAPLKLFSFNPVSGEHTGPAFTFDALELVNSTTKMEDPWVPLHDWFGILNAGERIFAVGSSDSHTVGDPVGQGRTYVKSSTDNPIAIDVDEVCESFRHGRMSVSQGIFVDVGVNNTWRIMGRTVEPRGGKFRVELLVATPHFVKAREARAYLNGIEVDRMELDPELPDSQTLTCLFELEDLPHDAYLVLAVRGDAVTEPFWHSLNPYTFGATNPVCLDVDGDGECKLPRDIAALHLERARWDPDVVNELDDAATIQLLVLARPDFTAREISALMLAAAKRDSALVNGYIESLTRD